MATRRDFLKACGAIAAGSTVAGLAAAPARAAVELAPDRVGVLSDLTLCIGCRKCEWGCAEANGLPHGELATYDDTSVFARQRRPDEGCYTVVNRLPGLGVGGRPLNVKVQCMHCEDPACASACLVGAMRKDPRGPVVYDAQRCIGCRYCMVACPFQIPTYEYSKPLTPQVQKCTLCFERTVGGGKPPACASICPVEAIQFGHRDQLLEIAHERIRRQPERYVDHVYGEHEAGGTSWLYLCNREMVEAGLPALPSQSPSERTEAIQHGIFKGFSGPAMLLGLLAIFTKITAGGDRDARAEDRRH